MPAPDPASSLAAYRDERAVRAVLDEIAGAVTRPHTIMEICGGQTHAIMRYGLDQLLPEAITLLHGPGCPVCVTPLETVDKALALAARPEVIFTSFGDMLRVPGSGDDLFSVKSRGGDVRVVYSPLDAVRLARENPARTVIFFAIGFETTAPANAAAIVQAQREGLENFAVLSSHVTVPPAIRAILGAPDGRVEAFLAAGHVCTVMGYWEYEPLAAEFGAPIVVTGFEPLDIARGILMAVQQLEEGRAEVENAYARLVTCEGNRRAQDLIADVFAPCDRRWRGIGTIPMSGYRIREKYAAFDAERRFPDVGAIETQESPVCISGLVLQGKAKPDECAAFGKECTPLTPLGATMVSGEGACAAYYRYRH